MTPGKFLRLVWPTQGFYCIAHPFKLPEVDKVLYSHHVFDNISAAVTHVHETAESKDVFFSVLSLAEAKVWLADKVNPKTKEMGKWATRIHQNMHNAKALFFDLDVGVEPEKFDTQREALAALLKFMADTGLPMPTLVSSGGGVHVYWHFDTEIGHLEWRDLAFQLRQLAGALGFKVDPKRTIDTSSVLRVPDTFNYKHGTDKRRPVKVLQEGVISTVSQLRRTINDALILRGVEPGAAPIKTAQAVPHEFGEQKIRDFGPPPSLTEVAATCGQVRAIIKSQAVKQSDPAFVHLDNSAWYLGMLSTFRHLDKGEDLCRSFTAMHPRTTADVEDKLQQLEREAIAPATCNTLAGYMPWGDTPCQTCPVRGKVKNPLMAARNHTPAPAPVIGVAGPAAPTIPPAASGLSAPLASTLASVGLISAQVQSILIPDPPPPYKRLAVGGIQIKRVDKDDNETTSIIYAHDLYPIKRLINGELGIEQQVWRTVLPRSGVRDFTIDADVLYDQRKFCVAIANNGIYPNKADIPALQDYMVAYISQLQKDLDADTQLSHLGWHDDMRSFVLPEKTLLVGSARASSLSEGAKRATQFVVRRGELAEQVKLLGFYNKPEYLPNQTVILDSLASILFTMTGNHGIVVNMSGESGASKSTTLYASASAWGDPIRWPLNATAGGATPKARQGRTTTNANLPTFVDEITNLPTKDVIDLCMSVTQPGARLRLGTDGSERTQSEHAKSAILICSANTSLHNVLSSDNAAGTAGSMRVFEIKVSAQRVHSKAEADEFLRQLNNHFGHLGEPFAQFVLNNLAAVTHAVQAKVREIDQLGRVASSERFWSARIACTIIAADICKAVGLLPYDSAPIADWSLNVQIPFMRGVVKEEYRDPLAILQDYILEKQGGIVVIERNMQIGTNTGAKPTAVNQAFAKNQVHGALLGHYDPAAGVMYLQKQPFKDHCNRVGASSARILDDLSAPSGTPARKIVVERQIRRTLGAGTDLAKGQSWCFAVDMTHSAMAGSAPVLAAQGGVPTQGGAPALSVVK